MILDYFRRLFGITDLDRRIENLYDERFQLSRLVGELSDQISSLREEMSIRRKVMAEELMESESRLMARIEELESPQPIVKEDTLVTETNKTGFTRWSERKRAKAAAAIEPSVWTKRLINGNIPRPIEPEIDVRGGNNQSGNG